MEAEHHNFNHYQQVVEKERMSRQQVIQELTEENLALVDELKHRDFNHQLLEQKMNEVNEHVSEVTHQLDSLHEKNQELANENQDLYDQVL